MNYRQTGATRDWHGMLEDIDDAVNISPVDVSLAVDSPARFNLPKAMPKSTVSARAPGSPVNARANLVSQSTTLDSPPPPPTHHRTHARHLQRSEELRRQRSIFNKHTLQQPHLGVDHTSPSFLQNDSMQTPVHSSIVHLHLHPSLPTSPLSPIINTTAVPEHSLVGAAKVMSN